MTYILVAYYSDYKKLCTLWLYKLFDNLQSTQARVQGTPLLAHLSDFSQSIDPLCNTGIHKGMGIPSVVLQKKKSNNNEIRTI